MSQLTYGLTDEEGRPARYADDPELVARVYRLSVLEGKSIREIGKIVGTTYGTTRRLIEEGRKVEAVSMLRDLEQKRADAGFRLDAMAAVLWEAMRQDGVSITDFIRLNLAIEERRARLEGTDAPARAVVATAEPEPSPDVVRAVKDAQLRAWRERQAIVEGEVVDGHTDGAGE